jgi:hypothetical protein
MAVKSPRDSFVGESFRLPLREARKRAKQLFEQFPSSSYMSEIESWQETEGIIEFKMKRLSYPIDQQDYRCQ